MSRTKFLSTPKNLIVRILGETKLYPQSKKGGFILCIKINLITFIMFLV